MNDLILNDLIQTFMNNGQVLITGATSGIGAAFAQHFAQNGYDLILTGHPDEKSSFYIKDLIEKYRINVEFIYADFSSDSDVAKVESIIKSRDIDILINNAGFGLGKLFWHNNIQDLEKMIKVHILAPVRFIYAALPNMIKKLKGTIISLSSLASFLPIPHDSLYSATKLFHNSLMESLHISLREMGIKIQVLCPGFVRTNFHNKLNIKEDELKNRGILKWMLPEEVVRVSIKNLDKKNNVVVIPGSYNKIIRIIYLMMPKRVFYNLASRHLQ
jgi:short-subunit dehydrogenase